MKLKLLPCPFCGSAVQLQFTVDKAWYNRFVRCFNCDATGPWQYCDNGNKKAMEAWNRRPGGGEGGL